MGTKFHTYVHFIYTNKKRWCAMLRMDQADNLMLHSSISLTSMSSRRSILPLTSQDLKNQAHTCQRIVFSSKTLKNSSSSSDINIWAFISAWAYIIGFAYFSILDPCETSLKLCDLSLSFTFVSSIAQSSGKAKGS